MNTVGGIEARSLSFESALQSLAALLHRIALLQFAPAAIADEVEAARLAPYAEAFDAEFLQLAYQIAIHGRDELPLAPDEATGFSMTLLRLFAFRPEQPPALGAGKGGGGEPGMARLLPPAPRTDALPSRPLSTTTPARPKAAMAAQGEVRTAPSAVASTTAPPAGRDAAPVLVLSPDLGSSVPPWEDLPPEAHELSMQLPSSPPALMGSADLAVAVRPAAAVEPVPSGPSKLPAEAVAPAPAAGLHAVPRSLDWHALLGELGLGGLNRELAQHCECVDAGDDVFRLRLSAPHRHLLQINRNGAEKLQEALSAHFGRTLRVVIEVGDIATETPAQRNQAEKAERHAAAVAALEQDPFVRELIERFDATLEEASVKPL